MNFGNISFLLGYQVIEKGPDIICECDSPLEHPAYRALEEFKDLMIINTHLSELLAVIFRDGGHYENEHGTPKAVKDALAVIHKMRDELVEADRLANIKPAEIVKHSTETRNS